MIYSYVVCLLHIYCYYDFAIKVKAYGNSQNYAIEKFFSCIPISIKRFIIIFDREIHFNIDTDALHFIKSIINFNMEHLDIEFCDRFKSVWMDDLYVCKNRRYFLNTESYGKKISLVPQNVICVVDDATVSFANLWYTEYKFRSLLLHLSDSTST